MPKIVYATFRADEEELRQFASQWPCFGTIQEPLEFQLDSKGDLVGIIGEEGLDGAGVNALIDDAKKAHYNLSNKISDDDRYALYCKLTSLLVKTRDANRVIDELEELGWKPR